MRAWIPVPGGRPTRIEDPTRVESHLDSTGEIRHPRLIARCKPVEKQRTTSRRPQSGDPSEIEACLERPAPEQLRRTFRIHTVIVLVAPAPVSCEGRA